MSRLQLLSRPLQASTSRSVTTVAQPTLLTFPPLTPLPRPHSIHVATLSLQAHHPYPLDLYTQFALHSARSLSIPTSGAASLPTKKSLYTVLKSPFVHKKAQENFERRTHKRIIKVFDADRSVVDLWLRYLKKNGIGGVGMKAQVFEWVDYDFGSREIESVEMDVQGEVAREAERIVKEMEKETQAAERPNKLETQTA